MQELKITEKNLKKALRRIDYMIFTFTENQRRSLKAILKCLCGVSKKKIKKQDDEYLTIGDKIVWLDGYDNPVYQIIQCHGDKYGVMLVESACFINGGQLEKFSERYSVSIDEVSEKFFAGIKIKKEMK